MTVEGQLTPNPHDKEPFRKKQPSAICSSLGKKRITSLTANLPEGIAAFLDVKKGDQLEWKMNIAGNEKVVSVRKVTKTELK